MHFGELAEWLRSGLQIRVHRFDSGTRLHLILLDFSAFFSLFGGVRNQPVYRAVYSPPGFSPLRDTQNGREDLSSRPFVLWVKALAQLVRPNPEKLRSAVARSWFDRASIRISAARIRSGCAQRESGG